jgi:hypothetical protein
MMLGGISVQLKMGKNGVDMRREARQDETG